MIIIKDGKIEGSFPEAFAYSHAKNPFKYFILTVTRYLRAINAEKYMNFTIQRHLDIGCGDGYLLKRSKAKERYGHEILIGDTLEDLTKFSSEFFDCITLLAVIEHIKDPSFILTHIWPILKHKGRLILTTPKKAAEKFIRLYVPGIEDSHEVYYDKESLMKAVGQGYILYDHHTFEFGLNQVFCLERKAEMV